MGFIGWQLQADAASVTLLTEHYDSDYDLVILNEFVLHVEDMHETY